MRLALAVVCALALVGCSLGALAPGGACLDITPQVKKANPGAVKLGTFSSMDDAKAKTAGQKGVVYAVQNNGILYVGETVNDVKERYASASKMSSGLKATINSFSAPAQVEVWSMPGFKKNGKIDEVIAKDVKASVPGAKVANIRGMFLEILARRIGRRDGVCQPLTQIIYDNVDND